jgi:P4 family phage/plasmid primase-like protien
MTDENVTRLTKYLSQFSVGKGDKSNYTTMDTKRSYYIRDGEEFDEFIKLYRKVVMNDNPMHMTQKHKTVGYLIIDLDLKYDKLFKKRRLYVYADILEIVKVINKKILEVLNVPNEKLQAFVSEKKKPNVRKNCVADGLHIVYPLFASSVNAQYLIRDKIVEYFENEKKFFKMFPVKDTIDTMFDKAVIFRNNWMLYGSCKTDSHPYKLTHILDHNLQEVPLNTYREKDLFKLLSVRKFGWTDCVPYVEKYDEELVKRILNKPKSKKNNNLNKQKKQPTMKDYFKNQPVVRVITKGQAEDIERARKIMKLLDKDRTNDYAKWIQIGQSLHGVDYTLLDEWIKFSESSPKFVKGECEVLWDKFNKYNYTIGTLCLLAKMDNPDGYAQYRTDEIKESLTIGLSGTSYDVAKVVHETWKHEYKCASIKHRDWFQFKNHRWTSIEEGYTLDNKLSEELVDEYCRLAAIYYMSATSASKGEKDKLKEKGSDCNKIIHKLKDSTFKDKIMKECRNLFYDPEFYNKLDENRDLIGFENGVYDLGTKQFREGLPEDYLTFSTKINYIPFNKDCPKVKWVLSFLKQVQPEKDMRKYVVALLSSYLQGHNPDEKFHIWTGTGCFAPGTKIMMSDGQCKNIEKIRVGDYVMGADGSPKKVSTLLKGKDTMYEINNQYSNYIVNRDHRLVLRCIKNIEINNTITWYEWKNNKLPIKYEQYFNKKSIKKIIESENYIKEGENFIVTVGDWLDMVNKDNNLQNIFSGYKKIVDMEDCENMDLNPYILGLWLHYGSPKNQSFVKLSEEARDYLLSVDVINKKGEITNEYYDIFNKNKLFDVYSGKHIPEKFLCSSIKSKLLLISGIESVKPITNTSNEVLANSLCRLYNGIGKIANIKINKQNNYDIAIVDSNIDLEGIINMPFKIKKLKKDNFCGFELDELDKRFLLEDFTVACNSNGKSKLVELFQRAFGQYCDILNVALLTKKRGGADAASPQLAKTKGKRFCVFQEPEDDDKIYVGLMKELSGGDEIETRKLFKDPIKFRPQFKLLLTCNKLPHIPATDKGTWRRLRVVEFLSEFVDKPNGPNQFKIDKKLSDKLIEHAEAFMSILIEEFHDYTENGLVEPKRVTKFTEKYREKSDVCLEFINETYDKAKDGKISITHMYTVFRNWHRMSFATTAGVPTRKDLIEYFEKHDYNYGDGFLYGYSYKESKVNKKKDLDD